MEGKDGLVVASWGWGLNSTWMIVKAIEAGEPPDVIVSLDTGVEYEDTYCTERWYVEHVWKPAGVEYVRLAPDTHPQFYDKRLEGRTLLEFCTDRRVVPLAAARWCSADWKARPGDRWMADSGVVENWLGFTAEETRRVMRTGCVMPDVLEAVNYPLPGMEMAEKKKKGKSWRVRAPLWEDGDTRRDCVLGLSGLGLLVPERSGCPICPFNVLKLLGAARGGDAVAVEWVEVVVELERAATENTGRRIGITPSGDRLLDYWEQEMQLEGLDVPVIYRPCECEM